MTPFFSQVVTILSGKIEMAKSNGVFISFFHCWLTDSFFGRSLCWADIREIGCCCPE
jgi:hypothetical protein